MSDNFTNNVHDVMESFQLAPSEDVWLKVQQGIQKEKKRKPKFFWWLFPLLALLVGGTYLMMQSNKQNGQVENAQQTVITQNKTETAVENSTNNKIIESEKETAVIDDKEVKGDAKAQKTDIASPEVVTLKKNETTKENLSLTSTVSFTNSNTERRNVDQSLNHENHFLVSRSKKQRKQKEKYNTENSNGEAGDYAAPIFLENNEESNLRVEEDQKTLQTIPSIELNTKIQNPNISITPPIKGNSNFSTQQDATNKPNIKPRKWHLSVVAGAGTSNLSNGLNGIFDAQKALSLSQNILVAGIPPQPSDIQPNAFYNVGIEVSYDLQKRLQLSAGLQFNAYSNSLQVGNFVSTPTRFFDLNGQFVFAKDEHYTIGNAKQFVNHYNYLNIPLSIDYEFAQAKTISFHVQAGLDLGYLMAKESLIFDANQNIYYAANTQLNNWRYGFHLGASVSLWKDQLSINPMLHFGLNDLYNTGTYRQLSLSSVGLQLKLRIQ